MNGINQHGSNFEAWLNEASDIVNRLHVARKPELYTRELSWINDKAEKYATFFSIPIPEQIAFVLAIRSKDEAKAYEVTKVLQNR